MKGIGIVLILSIFVSTQGSADSLFNKRVAASGTMVSAPKIRFEVGDIITVLVRESMDASTDSDLDTKKESTLEAESPISENPFLVGTNNGGRIIDGKDLPNWAIESEGENKSDGSTSRKNNLIMTISCNVVKVFDNGNVGVEGFKNITVNRESSKLKLSGVVRARDIAADNTVGSNQIANADIQLTGEGPLWNNQRRGFFTKILDWFSPF
jgi:flagellar L-ring protein precursor FlgH